MSGVWDWLHGIATTADFEWVTAGLAAAGALFVVLNRIGRMLNMLFASTRKFMRDFASMPDAVAKLSKEIMPNGGSSIGDVVRSLEGRITLIDQRQLVLIQASTQPMFRTDAEGSFVFANHAFLSFTGLTSDQLSGDGWVNAVYPSDRERVYEDWRAAVEQNRDFVGNYKLQSRDGKPVEFSWKAHVMRGSPRDGKLIGYYGILTETKQ